jgi:hypothetical protein
MSNKSGTFSWRTVRPFWEGGVLKLETTGEYQGRIVIDDFKKQN